MQAAYQAIVAAQAPPAIQAEALTEETDLINEINQGVASANATPTAPAAAPVVPEVIQPGSLTDDQVKQAIDRGNKERPQQIGLTLNDIQTAIFSGMACTTCGQSGYTIMVYTPEQWIELGAARAKGEMLPFSIADVNVQMRAPIVHVIALPSKANYLTGEGISFSSSVHRVVLNDTARQITIQPITVVNDTVQDNSALRSIQYTTASADFLMSDVDKLRASDSKHEFFIVVVGDNQNKFFKVKSRDFKKLFNE